MTSSLTSSSSTSRENRARDLHLRSFPKSERIVRDFVPPFGPISSPPPPPQFPSRPNLIAPPGWPQTPPSCVHYRRQVSPTPASTRPTEPSHCSLSPYFPSAHLFLTRPYCFRAPERRPRHRQGLAAATATPARSNSSTRAPPPPTDLSIALPATRRARGCPPFIRGSTGSTGASSPESTAVVRSNSGELRRPVRSTPPAPSDLRSRARIRSV